MWHELKRTEKINFNFIFWLFLLGILVSQFLSVQFNSDVRYDLRGIPLLIGGFYLGVPSAFLLYIGMLVIRAFYGFDLGFFISTVVYGFQFLFLSLLMKRYHQQTMKKKVLFSLTLSIFTSTLFMVTMFILHLSMSFFEWSIYILLFSLGSSIFTIAIETWKNHLFIRIQMIKTEKMEAVSQLAASISHEVRNPLTTVKGFLQLLKDGDLDRHKSQEFISMAIEEVDRANTIIHDYLTFAKPSIDKVEIMDVEKELTKTINVIQPLAHMNNIELTISLVPCFIKGDIQRFHQCIHNLLRNSVEAMTQGGNLTVISSLKGERVHIQISDTGIGMSDKQVHKLGEPYYSTKGSKGTGLGLMVSFGIIRAMKGTVHIESEVGKGTTFFLTFPLDHQTG